MSTTMSLAEAARAILTGKNQLDEFRTANGAEVVDHGPAIVHPLQGQLTDQDGGLKQDASIPGATGKQEPEGLSNPGSHTAKNGGAPGDKAGEGTLDGKGAPADKSIPGATGSKDQMNQKNPGSSGPKDRDEQSKGPGTLDGKGAPSGPTKGQDPMAMRNKGAIALKAESTEAGDTTDEKKPVVLTAEEKAAAQAAALAEHMKALTEGEDLPEAFKSKAKTIFEAAVAERANALREEIEAEYVTKLEEAIAGLKEESESKLDDYLSYLAQDWLKENKLAVDSGLKNGIMEDFVAGIRDLCVENNIEFPDAKIDVVEELTSTVEELETKLNAALAENVQLTKSLNTTSREKLVNEAVDGLVATKAAQLRKLAEGVTAETDEEFATKLKTLRESYTGNKPAVKSETLLEDRANVDHGQDTKDDVPSDMKAILSVLDRKPSFTK